MHMVATPNRSVRRVLQISMVATLAYVVTTLLVGLHIHSLALVSEAGHNTSDLLAIGLSFLAIYFQGRPPTDEKTFGYQRAGVLAAFVNAITLIALSVWIALAAIHRFASPLAIQPRPMMLVATAGVIMNGLIAALLWRFSGEVNIRSVFIHMLGDTISTAAVILGGFGILYTHLNWIDPLLSLLIAALILWSSIGIVRETLNILLEGTPRGVELTEVRTAIENIDGVVDVHDLHVWSLGPKTLALASHVTVVEMPISACTALVDSINLKLRQQFRIRHTTLQFEASDCGQTHDCGAALLAAAAIEDAHDHSHSHFGHSH
jgi:cobalt-zinc-cadmium efflux system protein